MDNTSKLLNYLNATRSASSEEDYNELFALLDPSTEDEMGGIYESVLGYNPIKYFDIQFLSDAITKGCESLPEEYMATIVDNKDEIITLTMDYFTDNKGEILTDILSEILEKYLPTAEIKKFINATGFEYETFIDDDDDEKIPHR